MHFIFLSTLTESSQYCYLIYGCIVHLKYLILKRYSGQDLQLCFHLLGCVWNGYFSFPPHRQAYVQALVPVVVLEHAWSIVNQAFPMSGKIIIC